MSWAGAAGGRASQRRDPQSHQLQLLYRRLREGGRGGPLLSFARGNAYIGGLFTQARPSDVRHTDFLEIRFPLVPLDHVRQCWILLW